MHRFRGPLVLAVSTVVAISFLWGTKPSPGTLFAWLVDSVVFGIPALVSVAFFILLAALVFHWIIVKTHLGQHSHLSK